MEPYFYHDKLCLNVLANHVENAKEIYEATEGHVIIGLLSSAYTSVEQAVHSIETYANAVEGAISLGLGSGNPKQAEMVAHISREVEVAHINQVFSAVGYTRCSTKNKSAFINGLVKPTEEIGYVNIATGPLSSEKESANIPIQTAISLIKEMGGNSLKLFPLNGMQHREHYKYIAEVCGKEQFALEPTGGIDLHNFEEIVRIALDAGVPKVIPHVYSSIIDKQTGDTRLEDVAQLYKIMKKVG